MSGIEIAAVAVGVTDDGLVYLRYSATGIGFVFDRDNILELIPYLQHFAEHGTLEEPEKEDGSRVQCTVAGVIMGPLDESQSSDDMARLADKPKCERCGDTKEIRIQSYMHGEPPSYKIPCPDCKEYVMGIDMSRGEDESVVAIADKQDLIKIVSITDLDKRMDDFDKRVWIAEAKVERGEKDIFGFEGRVKELEKRVGSKLPRDIAAHILAQGRELHRFRDWLRRCCKDCELEECQHLTKQEFGNEFDVTFPEEAFSPSRHEDNWRKGLKSPKKKVVYRRTPKELEEFFGDGKVIRVGDLKCEIPQCIGKLERYAKETSGNLADFEKRIEELERRMGRRDNELCGLHSINSLTEQKLTSMQDEIDGLRTAVETLTKYQKVVDETKPKTSPGKEGEKC